MISVQIRSADSEAAFKELIFDVSDVLVQAGYTKPLNLVSLEAKGQMIRTLLSHYGLLQVKAELDQFKEGLLKGMLLVEIQKNAESFLPVFTSVGEQPLTSG